MSYCPNCDNILDISKTNDVTLLEGGATVVDKEDEDEVDENKVEEEVEDKVEEDEVEEDEVEVEVEEDEDKVEKTKEKIKETKETKVYFVCGNCGFSKPIEPGTNIFSRSNTNMLENKSTESYLEMLNNNMIPRTRAYVCKNKTCVTHKDASKKEAVFFRQSNSFKVIYICKACKTTW
jgi:DNA-directed RNA polymerase subunit M/transcription elongation factor TFIIS